MNLLRRCFECGQPIGKKEVFCTRCGAKQPREPRQTAGIKAAAGGDWSRVKRCVRLCGYVSSAPDFFEQPKVVDGASDLMVQALGEAGRHSRSALGVIALRGNAPVVLDAIFELAG